MAMTKMSEAVETTMTKMSEAVETATSKTNTIDNTESTTAPVSTEAPVVEEPTCTLSEEQIEQIKSYYARVATNIYNYCKQYNRLDK